MTRQFIALFSFLCLSVLSAFADNQEIAINLNPGNNYAETVNLKDMAEMVVMALPTNDNESAHIVVQLKNTTGDSSGLLMFNVKYTEKETKDLKKEFFKIEWPDWLKARNTLKATTGLKPKVHFIDLGDSSILPLQIPDYKKNNNSFKIALTLYGCKITDRDKNTAQPKKVKINSEYSFPINILVELGPDTEFEALKDKCEAFVQEINKKTFCPFDTHKKHKTAIRASH